MVHDTISSSHKPNISRIDLESSSPQIAPLLQELGCHVEGFVTTEFCPRMSIVPRAHGFVFCCRPVSMFDTWLQFEDENDACKPANHAAAASRPRNGGMRPLHLHSQEQG